MANIYETRAARTDPRYRAWLTDVNYTLLMQAGAGMHENSALRFPAMRRWYLQGLDPYTVAKRLNTPR